MAQPALPLAIRSRSSNSGGIELGIVADLSPFAWSI